MDTLYITQNGLSLKKKSERIAVKKDGKIIEEFKTVDLKRILIFGNSQVTTELMRFLASKGVEVAFLSSHGKFRYRLVPEMTKNCFLRLAQYDRYRNEDFRVCLSRTLIKSKLKNQRSFLVRYQRNRPDIDLKKYIDFINDCIIKSENKTDCDQLRGIEGVGARMYFEAYGKLLKGGFIFTKREYHPPPDPINAMLSFGYMLLYNELSGLLHSFGFDIYIGYLHTADYGRASLANDLMEELRSPVIDRLVLYLINKSAIKITQFVVENKNVKMNEECRKIYLANYNNFMTQSFIDPQTKDQRCYREILKDRVGKFERVILDNSEYIPYSSY